MCIAMFFFFFWMMDETFTGRGVGGKVVCHNACFTFSLCENLNYLKSRKKKIL